MKPDPWSLVGALVILAGLLKVIHRLIRHWPKNGKAVSSITTESKRQSIPFFSASIISLTIAFGALLLLIVNAQQTSPSSRALSILAAGVAALVLFDVLALVIGVPAYNFITNLERKVEELRQQNQYLEEKVEALEARNQTMFPVQQVPVPRKPCKRKRPPQDHKVSTSQRRIGKKDKTEAGD